MVPFIDNKLLEEIEGKEIIVTNNLLTYSLSDGTLAGALLLSDGRWVNFFWDGERVIIRERE